MRVLKCKTDHRKLSLEISNVYIDNAQDNSLFQTIQTLITNPFFLVKKVHKMKLFSKTLVFGKFLFWCREQFGIALGLLYLAL